MNRLGWMLLSVALSSVSFAEEPIEGEEGEANAPEFNFQQGPMKATPGHNVELNVPEGYVFLGMPDAAKFMERNGSFYSENLLGVILPSSVEQGNWAAIVRFEDEGHVKDDEKIDAEELLTSFKDAEPDMNEARREKGFPDLHILGWKEVPHYDALAHKLVWGLEVKAEGDQDTSLNYNTRVLGRTGYVSLNFVTGVKEFAQDKKHADVLLANTRFQSGYTYADFNESTDKVAEYGLMGLIATGAGFGLMKFAKIGLLAKFGKVLLAVVVGLKKALVPVVLGLLALLKALGSRLGRLFGRKPEEEVTPPQDDAPAETNQQM